MVMRRKEKKEYGTGKIIEGIYKPGQKCVVVEDVITSGQSIFETIIPLRNEGLIVEDVVVLVDREQGGRKFIESQGIRVHSICSISALVTDLLKEMKIEEDMAHKVKEFTKANQLHA
jgi:uridine monophosphate synthetase